jgi:methyltransferase (TIGR00027 family)
VRSLFFDQFCAESGPDIRQTVILASGLDTRALRLAWPWGSTVFEIDQAAVLAFKDQVLAGRNGDGARRVLVPVDLRKDWAEALLAAGFEPARPSTWLVEGLLPYLPARAEAELFDRIDTLSHAGSRIAVEQVDAALLVERSKELSALLGIDIAELLYIDHREDPAGRLRRQGWAVSWTSATSPRPTGGIWTRRGSVGSPRLSGRPSCRRRAAVGGCPAQGGPVRRTGQRKRDLHRPAADPALEPVRPEHCHPVAACGGRQRRRPQWRTAEASGRWARRTSTPQAVPVGCPACAAAR